MNEIQTSPVLRWGPALPESALPPVPKEAGIRAWSAPATFGWAALIFVCMSIMQLSGALVMGALIGFDQNFVLLSDPEAMGEFIGSILMYLILVGATAALPVVIALLWFLTRKRENVRGEYLAWHLPRFSDVVRWTIWLVPMWFAVTTFSIYFPSEQNSGFMGALYSSSDNVLLFLGVVVAIPYCEEVLFRGFVFRGFLAESGKHINAIAISAGLWAAVHLQYDWRGLVQLFALGLFFGYARWRTNSTVLTYWLHALYNGIGLLQMWAGRSFFGG